MLPSSTPVLGLVRVLAAPLLASALLAGCGDDHPPTPPPPTDMMIMFDAGDGGLVDLDGTEDLSFPPFDGGTGVCRLEGDPLTLATDTIDRSVRLVDVAVNGTMFVVAWSDARSAVGDAYVYAWPAADATGLEYRVTDDFSLTRDVQLATRTGGFIVGWVDNTEGSFEVHARPLDALGVPSGVAQRVTNNMLREDSLRLTGLGGGGAMAAWIESDGLGGTATTRAVPLSATGAAVGAAAVASAPPRQPTELALSPLGTGAALAWNESGVVYLQPLMATGTFVGAAAPINTLGDASGGVALALDDAGGGVAFGVSVGSARAEVRMRTVGATGATVGPEAIVTLPPATGADPAVASYATGYAVAYRSSAADGTGTVRLAFATSTGEYASSIDIASTTAAGGGPRIAVAADGRVVVVWMEADATKASIHAAKVVCE